jgi:hypothetical protein
MWWLDDIIVPAVLILGVSCFVLLVRSSTRRSVRKTTTRTAEDLYPLYADSIRKQRKYAKEHGGQGRDDKGSGRPRLSGQQRGRPTPIPALARSGHALNDLLHGANAQFHPHAGSQKESPYGFHTISIAIPPAWRRLLLGDARVSELPCQEWPVSPRGCDWGVNRHQKWRTRVPGDPSRAARLIPRIPGAVRLWPKWARASWDTLLGLHDTGGTNEQPSQLRSHPGRTRCDPAR